jgi:hypothetical protein
MTRAFPAEGGLELVFAAALACAVGAYGCASTATAEEDGRGGARPGGDAPGAPGSPDDDVGGGERPAIDPELREVDVNHVLGTGQSLSLGAMGTPPLSREQPFENLMFDTGLEPGRTPTAFVPLVESATFMDEPVETPSSGMANLVAQIAREDYGRAHPILVSLHGESGASYPMIQKGTDSYARGLAQVTAAKSIAEAGGLSHVVRAVTVVHGESDGWQNWNEEYEQALLEWQSDVEADVRAITGQREPVPMFHSQYSAWSSVETTRTSIIPTQQLAAHLAAPGQVVLVGPKYQLPYADDGLHLASEGYTWLGEYYAKAYREHVLLGRAWEPLRPERAERVGASIVVRFVVPAPPLVLDTELVSDPGDFGFEVRSAEGAALEITAIELSGEGEVRIDLGAAPAAGALRVLYALNAAPGEPGGPTTSPRGNLRDSDPTRSRTGQPLFNWCVHFDLAVE